MNIKDPSVHETVKQITGESQAEAVAKAVTERQARHARQAYTDFGKGSGHPAGLNFVDCLSYALALDLREPLLLKGNDFGHTGVQSALENAHPT